MTDTPKYPQIVVRYEETGEIGDGLAILRLCIQEMKHQGISETKRSEFVHNATSGNYEDVKKEARKWVRLELT